jgi:hypothetical protein
VLPDVDVVLGPQAVERGKGELARHEDSAHGVIIAVRVRR